MSNCKKYQFSSNQLIKILIVYKHMYHSYFFNLFHLFHLLLLYFLNTRNALIELIDSTENRLEEQNYKWNR